MRRESAKHNATCKREVQVYNARCKNATQKQQRVPRTPRTRAACSVCEPPDDDEDSKTQDQDRPGTDQPGDQVKKHQTGATHKGGTQGATAKCYCYMQVRSANAVQGGTHGRKFQTRRTNAKCVSAMCERKMQTRRKCMRTRNSKATREREEQVRRADAECDGKADTTRSTQRRR